MTVLDGQWYQQMTVCNASFQRNKGVYKIVNSSIQLWSVRYITMVNSSMLFTYKRYIPEVYFPHQSVVKTMILFNQLIFHFSITCFKHNKTFRLVFWNSINITISCEIINDKIKIITWPLVGVSKKYHKYIREKKWCETFYLLPPYEKACKPEITIIYASSVR